MRDCIALCRRPLRPVIDPLRREVQVFGQVFDSPELWPHKPADTWSAVAHSLALTPESQNLWSSLGCGPIPPTWPIFLPVIDLQPRYPLGGIRFCQAEIL